MKNAKLWLYAACAMALLLLAACSSEPPVKKVTLVAEDIMWNMDEIDAQAGQTVELTLRNDGALDHNFVAKDLGLDVLLSTGQSTTVTFVVDAAGTYQYICSIPGHEEAGMVGEFVISE